MTTLTAAELRFRTIILRRLYNEDQKEEAFDYLLSMFGSFFIKKTAEKAWDSINWVNGKSY